MRFLTQIDALQSAMRDLAVHDLAAIDRHYANRTDIAGGYNRLFRFSFGLPVSLTRRQSWTI
jgi:hypothetical protein